MGIIAYKKPNAAGVEQTMYIVVADAINRYTGKRTQMKRRGIPRLMQLNPFSIFLKGN